MSPFLLSTKLGIWRDNLDMDNLYYHRSHHLGLTLLFLITSVFTYVFANSSKHAINSLLVNQLNLSSEESKNELDQISFIANLFSIILYLSIILEMSFLGGFNDELIKLVFVFSMLIIGLTINNHLDKKLRYHTTNYDFVFIHYIISIPVFILNTVVIMGISTSIIFR